MIKVKIDTVNQAFIDDFRGEIVQCLNNVKQMVQAGQEEGWIYDTYGNRVGTFKITEK